MFFIYSEEVIALCPHCGETLTFYCRVVRPLKDIAGTKTLYSINILKCENQACPTKYHRELPNIIVPYKRYNAESIETAISQSESVKTKVLVNESTIYRWREWFKSNKIYIMMALLSLAALNEDNAKTASLSIEKQNTKNPIEIIKKIVAREEKWLNETVRILVNSSKWIFNRSAILSM